MKKLEIILLLLLLCGTLDAQWSPWLNNVTRYGTYSLMVKGDSTAQMVYIMGPLDENGNLKTTVSDGASAANQTNGSQITQIKSSINWYPLSDTSTAAVKHISFGFTSKTIGVNNDETGFATDSTTLWIGADSLFAKAYPLYATDSYVTLPWAVTEIWVKWGKTTMYANKKSRYTVN